MELIKKLQDRCKCSITLTINQHRDYYQTVQEYIDEHNQMNDMFKDIPEDIIKKMVETNTIVELQYYPDTPVGFCSIVGHSIDYVMGEIGN